MSTPRSVIVEADGGSRGNPGQAAYGALIKDADTGEVLAERGERIGLASNNVAEYRGLIAGLQLYARYADGAELEVRMDSKLVVEQMSGRWKIKHPDMQKLAVQAQGLVPSGATFTWIPRENNKHADLLANLALDSDDGALITSSASSPATGSASSSVASRPRQEKEPRVPLWALPAPTRLILVRHGETDDTMNMLFSGSAGANPGLNSVGKAHVDETASWLASLAEHTEVRLVASPMKRTRETAQIVAGRLGVEVAYDDGLVEADFGSWEGKTYEQVIEADEAAFAAWLDDLTVPAGGTGDSMASFVERLDATVARIVEAHRGQTIVVVSHLTPIRTLVHRALGLEISMEFVFEIAPASVSEIAWYADGRTVLKRLNSGPRALA